MFIFKIIKKLIIFSVLFFAVPFFVFAINDVVINDEVDFDLVTSNNATSVVVTLSSGGQATELNIPTTINYIDITLDNASTLSFSIPAGKYFKITKQSGSDDYTVSSTCPTNTVTLAGTGAQVVLRLQVQTTDPCATPPPSGGGSSGGGTYIPYVIPVTNITTDAGALCPNGMTVASNCTVLPQSITAEALCPNGNTIASNCTVAPSQTNITTTTTTTSSTTSNTTCTLYMTEYIKQGLKNNPVNVKKLQQFLKDYEGFTILKVDGIFGPISLSAVKKFQLKYAKDILTPWNLTKPTGWVYKTTLKKINELYCKYTSQ